MKNANSVTGMESANLKTEGNFADFISVKKSIDKQNRV